MASLLSKFSSSNAKLEAAKNMELAQETDRRANLLSGLEKADLGWFWQSDSQGRLTYISPKACASLGLQESEMLGKELTEMMATDNSPGAGGTSRPLQFRLKSRSPISRLNVQVTCSNKETWWEISAGPRLDAEGNFQGLHGTARHAM
ncbi:MAG: hypothetical protein CL955_00715 [Erythrobacteraceae bacterium]|nr:hypothetical protein [Erythrobacteraceae bacterium]